MTKATSPPHTDGSVVFVRYHQCALCSPSNTWIPGPTRVHITNSISISSAIFAELTAGSPWIYNRPPYPLKIAPSHGGSGPYPMHDSLGPTPQTASWLVQPFLQGSWLWHTDREIDNATPAETRDRIHVVLWRELKHLKFHDNIWHADKNLEAF